MNLLIKTPRLQLRPHGLRYLETTYEYARDPENTRYMLHLPKESVEETREFLTGAERDWASDRPGTYEFAILLDGVHIGACCLNICDEERSFAEPGWIINRRYWNKGYAAEAAAAMIRWGVDDLGIREYIAHCDGENIGSYRVMEKLGMHRVSLLPGRRNRSADRDSMELTYAMTVSEDGYAHGRDTVVIRELRKNEYHLLNDFLYEAIFIPEGAVPPPREIISQPELQVYTKSFGGEHDNAFIAIVDGQPAGIVWTRIMNDYGHVDDETPSFAISLFKQYRGRGIGTLLMKEMLDLLSAKGYKQASLAVQKANYAVKMYREVGFEIIGGNEEEHIMVCRMKENR